MENNNGGFCVYFSARYSQKYKMHKKYSVHIKKQEGDEVVTKEKKNRTSRDFFAP